MGDHSRPCLCATPRRAGTGQVLGLVATTSRREVQWLTEDVGRIFYREWKKFIDAIPVGLRTLRPVDAYATMLAGPDPALRDQAARSS